MLVAVLMVAFSLSQCCWLCCGGEKVVFLVSFRVVLGSAFGSVMFLLLFRWRWRWRWRSPMSMLTHFTTRVLNKTLSSLLLTPCGVCPPPVSRDLKSLLPHGFQHRERPTDAGGSPDGAPASSGVEVLSSDHYDVRDDENPDDSSSSAAVTAAAGAGSRLQKEEGAGGVVASAAMGRAAADAAGGGVGSIAPEILIRPPSYGFNDKV